jgi:hypothetical protein
MAPIPVQQVRLWLSVIAYNLGNLWRRGASRQVEERRGNGEVYEKSVAPQGATILDNATLKFDNGIALR